MKQDPRLKPKALWHTANGLLTFDGCFIAREPGEPSRNEKLETEQLTGASFDEAVRWVMIDWKPAERQVRRLQVRIAKAVKANRWGKVKTLQHQLVLRQAAGC